MAIARVACSIWTCWHTLRITGATSRKHCIHTSAVICVGYMYSALVGVSRATALPNQKQAVTEFLAIIRARPPSAKSNRGTRRQAAGAFSHMTSLVSTTANGIVDTCLSPRRTGPPAERSVSAPLRGDKVVASRVSCEKKVTSSHPSGQLKLS